MASTARPLLLPPLRLLLPAASLLLLLLLLLGCVEQAAASEATAALRGKRPYDSSRDWSSHITAQGPGSCTFAKKADHKPPPSCPPPRRPVTRAEASGMGVKFAPILFQHPLDNSWLTDPAKWFKEAKKIEMATWQELGNYVVPPGAGATPEEFFGSQKLFASRLVNSVYDVDKEEVVFDDINSTLIREKAILDPVVNGRLTGKVYYTVFRPFDVGSGNVVPNAYVFTYTYYYPWNGCSNQMMATQVDGRNQGIEYYMCPDGHHEGDLEHVKVYVCEDNMYDADPAAAIQRSQYSQHGWLPDFDCRAGECKFETDEAGVRRLAVYAALFSHANHNHATPLFVYEKVRLAKLLNMDGLYIADRFARGPVLYPNASNTIFLPYMSEMTQAQRDGEFQWATFPGTWGATIVSTNGRSVTCLVNNMTREVPCTRANPAFFILDVMVRTQGRWHPDNLTYGIVSSGNTVSGPLWRRLFTFNWEMERVAPLHTSANGVLTQYDGLCPFEAPIVVTEQGPGFFHRTDLWDFIGTLVGLVLASSVVAFAMVLPIMLVRKDEEVLKQMQEEQQLQHQQQQQNAATSRPVAEETEQQQQQHKSEVVAVEAAEAAGQPPCISDAPGSSQLAGQQRPLSYTVRMSYMELSNTIIMRAFHASVLQPYLLTVWIFVGIVCYIVAVVLGVIGIKDVATALNRIAPLYIWKVLSMAVTAVFAIFGIVHLFIIIASLYIRPTAGQLCGRWCGKGATGLAALRSSWRAHAVLAGLLAIEIQVTMLIFALGLMLWVARTGVEEACVFTVSKVFEAAVFLQDICMDLSGIGLSDKVCGSDLFNLCGFWSDLSVDYLAYASMLFMMAQTMFLVLASTNYVGLRTGAAITAAMQLANQATVQAERSRQAALKGGAAGPNGGRRGWSGLFAAVNYRKRTAGAGGNTELEDRAKSAPAITMGADEAQRAAGNGAPPPGQQVASRE